MTVFRDDTEPLSEPLTKTRLAELWKVSRNNVGIILERMPGVLPIGGRYMVPLSRLPVGYWIEAGIIDPDAIARWCALQRSPVHDWGMDDLDIAA